MQRFHVVLFVGVVVLALLAGLWSYGFVYAATSIFYSDLLSDEIMYGDPVWNAIVATAQKQVRLVLIPLAVTNLLALIGWGHCLFHCSTQDGVRSARSGENA
jgi:hypothetical protein